MEVIEGRIFFVFERIRVSGVRSYKRKRKKGVVLRDLLNRCRRSR